jgi:hypothetical protein
MSRLRGYEEGIVCAGCGCGLLAHQSVDGCENCPECHYYYLAPWFLDGSGAPGSKLP